MPQPISQVSPSSSIDDPGRPLVTVGVLADTHIPDRRRDVPAVVSGIFRAAGVDAIFHAGDICVASVLRDLSALAPVTAVRGNRDWLLRGVLPLSCTMVLAGVDVALTHGHGGMLHYLIDKSQYMVVGYRLERYQRLLRRMFPEAGVIIFGHTHFAVNRQENGTLLFNPGSACCPDSNGGGPSVGILRFYPQKQVVGEIVLV